MNPAMDALQARAAAQLDRLCTLQERCAAITVRETSADGAVSVAVDGVGALTALSLQPGAVRLGGSRLGALIVQTATAAAHQALARRALLTEEFNESFGELLDSRDA